jgi:hypothetical protein
MLRKTGFYSSVLLQISTSDTLFSNGKMTRGGNMDLLVSEAVSEHSRLGLIDLLQRDSARCKLRFNKEPEGFLYQ